MKTQAAAPVAEEVGVKSFMIDVPNPMVEELERLLNTGLWGRSMAEVIERLAALKLREIRALRNLPLA